MAVPSDVQQYNFDGIPGPTHQYKGLGYGNPLSEGSAGQTSRPKQAALQGLCKARELQDLGVPQALLPPLTRPYVRLLIEAGFLDEASVSEAFAHQNFDALAAAIERLATQEPGLVSACFSASGMWVANWATVTPSTDASDNKLHFSVANLVSNLHRSIEPVEIKHILASIFSDKNCFAVHDPLSASVAIADEGAANHMRIASAHNAQGIHVFVYGAEVINRTTSASYAGRQTKLASRCVATANHLPADRWTLARQSPTAISAGVFHNDVICMSNRNTVVCHEHAFVDQAEVRQRLVQWASDHDLNLNWIEVTEAELSLSDAVNTYLFNSQITEAEDGTKYFVCEKACQRHNGVQRILSDLQRKGAFDRAIYVDLEQSLKNGGGPACVRLRIEINPKEKKALTNYRGLDPREAVWRELETIIHTMYQEEWNPGKPVTGTALRNGFEAVAQIRECLGIKLNLKG